MAVLIGENTRVVLNGTDISRWVRELEIQFRAGRVAVMRFECFVPRHGLAVRDGTIELTMGEDRDAVAVGDVPDAIRGVRGITLREDL